MIALLFLALVGVSALFGILLIRSKRAWRTALRRHEATLIAHGLLPQDSMSDPGTKELAGPDRLQALAATLAKPSVHGTTATAPQHNDVQHFVSTLLDRIDDEVDTAIQGITNHANYLAGRADAMASAAEIANINAEDVTIAVQEMVSSTDHVAQTARSLDQSVNESRNQVEKTAVITRSAVAKCDTAAQSISDLTDAVATIDDIIMLIGSVAEQTNLLALNATIEAARAGDAGRGFAVVAGEVKTLATQTAQSTENIKAKIIETNRLAQAAHHEFQEVNDIVREVERLAHAVSQAIHQQAEAASGIAGESTTTLTGIRSASSSLGEIRTDASESESLAQEVRDGVLEINGSIVAIKDAIGGVLTETRKFSEQQR